VHNLIVVDPATFFDVAGFPWADGDDASARAALVRGGGVFLPATTAVRLGLERGDTVTLQTRKGPHDFELVATYASIAAGQEIGFVAGLRDGRALFGPNEPNVLYIGFEEDAAQASITRSVENELAGRRATRGSTVRLDGTGSGGYNVGRFFFITGTAIKAQARGVVDTYLSMFLAVLFVGMLVGLLGLANTLATSVMQRYREIGALQAIGASPEEVRRMIVIEAAALVLAALALSVVLGALLSRVILTGGGSLLGFTPPYVFPWSWLPALAVLAVVVALAAAMAPARRAARLTPIEALRYE
jgi:putative ABC transport system permease protein